MPSVATEVSYARAGPAPEGPPEALDDVALDGDAPPFPVETEAEVGGRKARKLILDDADVAAARIKAECAAHEGRETVFEVNERRLRALGLGVQVVEHEAGLARGWWYRKSLKPVTWCATTAWGEE
jgi:hypothetical protein